MYCVGGVKLEIIVDYTTGEKKFKRSVECVKDEDVEKIVNEINYLVSLNEYKHLLSLLHKNLNVVFLDYTVSFELFIHDNVFTPHFVIRSMKQDDINFRTVWEENRDFFKRFLENILLTLKDYTIHET